MPTMIKAYTKMCERALSLIEELNDLVILTETFSKPQFKFPLLTLAHQLLKKDIPFITFLLTANESDILARIDFRAQEGKKNASNITDMEGFSWAKNLFTPTHPIIEIKNTSGNQELALQTILSHLADFN